MIKSAFEYGKNLRCALEYNNVAICKIVNNLRKTKRNSELLGTELLKIVVKYKCKSNDEFMLELIKEDMEIDEIIDSLISGLTLKSEEEKWVSIPCAAKLVNRDSSTIRKVVKNGKLFKDNEIKREGKHVYILRDALERKYIILNHGR